MRDEQIDNAIDEVARRMTDGEPGAAFTSSVLEQLDDRRMRPRPQVRRPAVAGLALAAAALALVFWMKPHTGDVRLKTPVDVAREIRPKPPLGTAPSAAAPVEAPDATAGRPVTTFAAHGSQPRDRPTRQPIDALAPSPLDIAPATIAPVAVDPIEVADVAAPALIDPQPLEPPAPIAVVPLGVEDPQRRLP